METRGESSSSSSSSSATSGALSVAQGLVVKLSAIAALRPSPCADILQLCSEALGPNYDDLDTNRRKTKEAYAAVYEHAMSAQLPQLEVNHSLRFPQDPLNPERAGATAAGGPRKKSANSLFALGALTPRDYETVTSADFIRAPITDICIVQKSDPVPEGYYRVSRTPTHRAADLKTGTGGNKLFICIRKEQRDVAPVTAMAIILPDQHEHIPPGFVVVKREGRACNLNSGTSGERIFLCFKRDNASNPLTDIQVILSTKGETAPPSYNVLNRSIGGRAVDLNMGTGGPRVLLSFRQRLDTLESLRICNPGPRSRIDFGGFEESHERSKRAVSVDKTSASAVAAAVSGSAGSTRSKSSSEADKEKCASQTDGLSEGAKVKAVTAEGSVECASSGEGTTKLAKDNVEVAEELEDFGSADGSAIGDDDDVRGNNDGEAIDSALCPVMLHSGAVLPESYRRYLHPIFASVLAPDKELFEAALEGIDELLLKTDFFESAFVHITSSESIKTSVDLLVECLCDRFDFFQESEAGKLIITLRVIINKSRGTLSVYSMRKIFRITMLLSSYYSSQKKWAQDGMIEPTGPPADPMIFFDLMKDLISSYCSAAEACDLSSISSDPNKDSGKSNWFFSDKSALVASNTLNPPSSDAGLVEETVKSIVDDSLVLSETTDISEKILMTVSKQSSSCASPAFWNTIEEFACSLFKDPAPQKAIILLASICKIAWLSLGGYTSGGENIDIMCRHFGNKLFALDCIREFCRRCGYKMRACKVVGFQIRRLVVSCLLANIEHGLVETRIFFKIMKICTVLWRDWREHLRAEFPILSEQLVVRVLSSPPNKLSLVFQMIVLREIMKWFEQPHLTIEMYFNFELNSKFASDWTVFGHITQAVCTLAENCAKPSSAAGSSHSQSPNDGPLVSTQDLYSVGDIFTMFGEKCVPVTVMDVRIKALEVVGQISRSVMDASGHANLMFQNMLKKMSLTPKGADEANNKWSEDATNGRLSENSKPSIFSSFRSIHTDSTNCFTDAMQIFREKESIGKAIDLLVKKGYLVRTPQEFATFIRLYCSHFDPTSLGEFLGEGGRTKEDEHFWDQTRLYFTRAINFTELSIEAALRLYFTSSGFRVPGEAQKIYRFVVAFVKCFWDSNVGTQFCPFRQEDTVHLLAYAIIMLNTDLHRAGAGEKRTGGKVKKMTRDEFVHNLRGCDVDKETGQRFDIEAAYLSAIYDSIAQHPMELSSDANTMSSERLASNYIREKRMSFALGANDPIDAAAAANSLPAAAPHAFSSSVGSVFNVEQQKQFSNDLIRGARVSGEILRSMADVRQKFFSIGTEISITIELVSMMFESVWYYFHSVTATVLTHIKNEENVLFGALDVICNALTCCVFLDMTVEKLSLANQLVRFKQLISVVEKGTRNSMLSAPSSASSSGSSGTRFMSVQQSPAKASASGNSPVASSDSDTVDCKQEKWFVSIEHSTIENSMATVSDLHKMIAQLKDIVRICARRGATKAIINRIEKKANLLNPDRVIIKDGDLNKRCRNGKMVQYKFFLFTDILVYAHLGFSEYKVHVQLSLESMTVSDVDPADDPSNRCFYIDHPTKSFVVEAASPDEKRAWAREISTAITSCINRRALLTPSLSPSQSSPALSESPVAPGSGGVESVSIPTENVAL